MFALVTSLKSIGSRYRFPKFFLSASSGVTIDVISPFSHMVRMATSHRPNDIICFVSNIGSPKTFSLTEVMFIPPVSFEHLRISFADVKYVMLNCKEGKVRT